MIELAVVDPRCYDPVVTVVDELVSVAGVDPDSVLVVGAACRDILHSALGHTFPLRGTTDTDLGIAIGEWSTYDRIDNSFRRTGSNGIRYLVGDIPVDIMPFGGVEDPEGIATPSARGEDLVVFGFRDVHEHALALALPGGRSVRIPQPAGYAALKMRAFVDRSPHGEDKDAKDLALAAFWYQRSQQIQDRLYDTDSGFEVLLSVDMDADAAAIRLLANDAAEQLSPNNRKDLAQRWADLDLDLLARDFVLPAAAARPTSSDHRRRMVEHLMPPSQ